MKWSGEQGALLTATPWPHPAQIRPAMSLTGWPWPGRHTRPALVYSRHARTHVSRPPLTISFGQKPRSVAP